VENREVCIIGFGEMDTMCGVGSLPLYMSCVLYINKVFLFILLSVFPHYMLIIANTELTCGQCLYWCHRPSEHLNMMMDSVLSTAVLKSG